ncbi:MAG: DUF924 domain-containing protein [Gammaproteobacteria bacterium]|nr:DUF924 domain-containing protein [Gammaproteobacteria bacterium]
MEDPIGRLLDHWFGPEPRTDEEAEALFSRWFDGGEAVDRDVRARFGDAARAAAAGELDHWADSARGRLALILLLDQVPRHLQRGSAAAFEQDGKAAALSSSGIDRRMDRELPALERAFFYLPLQHAESLPAQERSVQAYEALAAEHPDPPVGPMLGRFLEYARVHRDIVERFGRFPHRNRHLNRSDTDEERLFLRNGGPTFGQ